MNDQEKITLAIDPVEKKVGCVLLQAAYGSDYQSINFHTLFPVETWLIHPTDNLQLYSITLADVKKLSAYLKERIENEAQLRSVTEGNGETAASNEEAGERSNS